MFASPTKLNLPVPSRYAPALLVPVALPGPPLGPNFTCPLLESESNITVPLGSFISS